MPFLTPMLRAVSLKQMKYSVLIRASLLFALWKIFECLMKLLLNSDFSYITVMLLITIMFFVMLTALAVNVYKIGISIIRKEVKR